VILVVLLAGCGASTPARAAEAPTAPAAATRSRPATPAGRAPRATSVHSPTAPSPSALPVAPGAGSLPQTSAVPRTDTRAFKNAMADLWLAVTTGNPRLALPGFFPESAYDKLKAITNPASDWRDRLWYDFVLDVHAAHDLLAGRRARLVKVIVPSYDAGWIPPGACYNSIGYWHVGGSRVVYTVHGKERSFGIASLISWRGVWYVVHFGEVLRPVVTGVVDQPTVGPGIPGPAGGC
jgi:hypothetical protein